jgi:hypothetical protein
MPVSTISGTDDRRRDREPTPFLANQVHSQATDFISEGIDIVAIAATIEATPAKTAKASN